MLSVPNFAEKINTYIISYYTYDIVCVHCALCTVLNQYFNFTTLEQLPIWFIEKQKPKLAEKPLPIFD